MSKISYNINLTVSKIMGIIIICGGLGVGYIDNNNMTEAIALVGIGAGMITTKTIMQKWDD